MLHRKSLLSPGLVEQAPSTMAGGDVGVTKAAPAVMKTFATVPHAIAPTDGNDAPGGGKSPGGNLRGHAKPLQLSVWSQRAKLLFFDGVLPTYRKASKLSAIEW